MNYLTPNVNLPNNILIQINEFPNNENVYVQNNEISAQFIIPMPTNRGDTYLYENNNTSNAVYVRNKNIDRMSVRILKTNNDFFLSFFPSPNHQFNYYSCVTDTSTKFNINNNYIWES